MLKWFGIASTILLLIFTTTVAPATAALKFITDKMLLDAYGQPNEQGDVMLQILSGTQVDVVEIRGDYVKIKNRENKTGWIHNKYLSNEKPTELAFLQTQKKFEQASIQLAKLKEQQFQSYGNQKAKQELSALKQEHEELGKVLHETKSALVEKTDALNKTNSTIVLLTDEITAVKTKSVNQFKTQLSNARFAGAPIPHAFTLSIAWTAAAILLAAASGFLFGIKWIENRIARKHGGVRIS